MSKSVIWWVRQDLRLHDNPALRAAVTRAREASATLLPVYVWAPLDEGPWPVGAASRTWLARSLRVLRESLREHGSDLFILHAESASEAFAELFEAGNVDSICFNRRYEPSARGQEAAVVALCERKGVKTQAFDGNLLWDPTKPRTKQGRPYQVYTAFWNSMRATDIPEAAAAPRAWPALAQAPAEAQNFDSFLKAELEPRLGWDGGFFKTWTPGEAGARKQLASFAKSGPAEYTHGRDRPAEQGTSRLSPHLHFGEISARAVWHAILASQEADTEGAEKYRKEIVWREFSHHLIVNFPHTESSPLRAEFSKLATRPVDDDFRAWTKGLTGYPIVDAGMRELWHTGWMHNRVRMIAASFLVKDLLVTWSEGARWFWDTLVDADLAQNTLGWQWTAGCGADAAPFFRVFNPTLQGEKFDPEGEYVKRWIPELARVPKGFIHKPWTAKAADLAAWGASAYPAPVVDHAEARGRALRAFNRVSK